MRWQNVAVAIVVIAVIAVLVWALTRRSYYASSSHPVLDIVRSNFTRLDPSYANIPLSEADSSYTENKSTITLCLKNKSGRYYDINTVMYVALHELAHVLSHTHGHGDEFRQNFADLLRRGAAAGIYDPRQPIPATYCGVGGESGG